MRITHRAASQNIKAQINRRAEGLEQAWRHVSSGKRVERPSDDPAAVSRILTYRSLLNEVEQRRFQATQGISVLTTADTAIGEAGKILEKAQELALASGSGSANEEDRKVMGVQVEQLLRQLRDVARTQYDDRPLFAAGAGNFSATDMSGLELDEAGVFGPTMAAMEQLQDELSAGQRASNDSLGDLKGSLDNLLSYRTRVGARTNRLEMLESRLMVMEHDLIKRRSIDEEVDLGLAMIELKEEENAYQAALAASARVMRIQLVDFL